MKYHNQKFDLIYMARVSNFLINNKKNNCICVFKFVYTVMVQRRYSTKIIIINGHNKIFVKVYAQNSRLIISLTCS